MDRHGHLGWVGEVVDVTPRIRIRINHARGLCDDDDTDDECRRPTKNTTTRGVLCARRRGVGVGGVAKGCDVRGWVRGAVRDGWVFFIFIIVVFGNHHG